MAWETSLTNRREDGRNRTRDRKGTSEPEDPAHKREPLTERGFRALAEPRPVLRGLRHDALRWMIARAGHPACRAETRSQGIATIWTNAGAGGRGTRPRLAEPRPVLRGLRRGHTTPPSASRNHTPCRAETRSQGIATCELSRGHHGNPLGLACRAETRSQGIATVFQSELIRAPMDDACRAETRSQGIATKLIILLDADPHGPSLQSRDPFSGDCDPEQSLRK